jgi:hypothetical protein
MLQRSIFSFTIQKITGTVQCCQGREKSDSNILSAQNEPDFAKYNTTQGKFNLLIHHELQCGLTQRVTQIQERKDICYSTEKNHMCPTVATECNAQIVRDGNQYMFSR